MKRLDVYTMLAAGLLALAAGGCGGEDGATGPEGPQGAEGPIGLTGPQGPTGPAGGVVAYQATGGWYDGTKFVRTFAYREPILKLNLPDGNYQLSASLHLRKEPNLNVVPQSRIMCDVGQPTGLSVGASSVLYVTALDDPNTVPLTVVGTGRIVGGVAELKCYENVQVAVATLTAIPIAQLNMQ